MISTSTSIHHVVALHIGEVENKALDREDDASAEAYQIMRVTVTDEDGDKFELVLFTRDGKQIEVTQWMS